MRPALLRRRSQAGPLLHRPPTCLTGHPCFLQPGAGAAQGGHLGRRAGGGARRRWCGTRGRPRAEAASSTTCRCPCFLLPSRRLPPRPRPSVHPPWLQAWYRTVPAATCWRRLLTWWSRPPWCWAPLTLSSWRCRGALPRPAAAPVPPPVPLATPRLRLRRRRASCTVDGVCKQGACAAPAGPACLASIAQPHQTWPGSVCPHSLRSALRLPPAARCW